MSAKRFLTIDADLSTTEVVATALRDCDLRVVSVSTLEAAEEELHHHQFVAIFVSLDFPDGSGFAFIQSLHRRQPQLTILATSSSSESQIAIEAVKSGAFDFIPKPLPQSELAHAAEEAISRSEKSVQPVVIDPENRLPENPHTLIGNSRAMLDVYKALGHLSPTPVTVLIRGETGTGKELVARALYQHGHRSHLPFITVNCAAIPENLLESELFGHEKGAFTGAIRTRIGKFEQANGATLFLDEIGDLDLSLQAKLLRVLQEKRFQRVGGSEEFFTDVRIIAATHRNLEEMIAKGEFREDLFYRLNVAIIKLPPLRDRPGDVALLSESFVKRYRSELDLPPATITRSALSMLESARLPGNVRQLQNLIRKALLRSRGYPIDHSLIAELLIETEPVEESATTAQSITEYAAQLIEQASAGDLEHAHLVATEHLESELIRAALNKSQGNISQAAKWLGLSRLTVREKAKKFGLLA